ncbi:Lrp/AsnC family transcriptional regulator [Gluconacetobacter entanii]|uniref:Transcriptional regulator n=1 Tax=Gluconacetobacter entanii TaxID=108528 RepID=A0A318PW85_9PROT|nr:Lrp/AsnC family transcriptional regulator [Gluconacetobacter entanii]PYD63305.1 transcriptional regulator [Gluconacetobacter entanii]
MSKNMDHFYQRILRALQNDASLSQRELADRVGLSQNACWRRVQALRERKVITGQTVRLDTERLGLGLTVFVMVRTRHHSREWLQKFRMIVLGIPNVIDFYRIAGDYDYMLKIMSEDMNAFDAIYQRLIEQIELDSITSYITMEAIANNRDLPVC